MQILPCITTKIPTSFDAVVVIDVCYMQYLEHMMCVISACCLPQKKTPGQWIFDHVSGKLGVTEREYFGLLYEDEQKCQVRNTLIRNGMKVSSIKQFHQ